MLANSVELISIEEFFKRRLKIIRFSFIAAICNAVLSAHSKKCHEFKINKFHEIYVL